MKKNSELTEGFLFANKETEKKTEAPCAPLPRRRGRKRSMETEDRPPLTAEQMRQILEDIHEIKTPTGIQYVNLRLTKRMVIGVRESSGKEFTINLDDLYGAYLNCLRFTSPEVKRHIFMGHSPAVVILREIKAKANLLSNTASKN